MESNKTNTLENKYFWVLEQLNQGLAVNGSVKAFGRVIQVNNNDITLYTVTHYEKQKNIFLELYKQCVVKFVQESLAN